MSSKVLFHWTDARLARWLLPAGLVAGGLAPSWGAHIQPLIPLLIGSLLFVACLRVNPAVSELLSTVKPSAAWVFIFQLLLPTAAAFALAALEVELVWRVPILFALAAAPVTGAPNMISMLGGQPQVALTCLFIGTAVLPITALPMLWTLPTLHTGPAVLATVGRLIFTIFMAIFLAFVVRRLVRIDANNANTKSALDLIASALLAIVVIGLMSGLHAPETTWKTATIMLLFACALNGSMHVMGVLYAGLSRRYCPAIGVQNDTAGVMGGNRNMALLLTALPMAAMEPHLLFLACYQVPMYLTPVIAALIYRR